MRRIASRIVAKAGVNGPGRNVAGGACFRSCALLPNDAQVYTPSPQRKLGPMFAAIVRIAQKGNVNMDPSVRWGDEQ